MANLPRRVPLLVGAVVFCAGLAVGAEVRARGNTARAPQAELDLTGGESPGAAQPAQSDDRDEPLGGGRDLTWFAFPGAGYSPETSALFTLGALVEWRLPSARVQGVPPSLFTVFGTYTLNRQWLVASDAALVSHEDRHRWKLSVMGGSWRREYFGVGPHRPTMRLERFDRRFLQAGVEWAGALLRSRLYAGLRAAADVSAIGALSGGALEADAPLGLQGGAAVGAGPVLFWDSRDDPLFPHRGIFARASLLGHSTLMGRYGFWAARLDARAFTSRRRHVWASRLLLDVQSPGAPFYLLSDLGDRDGLRGITEGRDLGQFRYVGVSEYRTPTRWRLGGVVFAGAGDARGGSTGRGGSRAAWSAGGGLRFRLLEDSSLNLRVDAGFSRDDRGVYVSVGEAF